MAFSLFGFTINRQDVDNSAVQSFVQPSITDELGIANLVGTSAYGIGGYSNASESATSAEVSENTLIMQYREVAMNPEVDSAIEEIVSEAIIADELQDTVKIDLSLVDLSDPIKDKVRESFKKTLRLLDFKSKGYDIFRRWYIDGRLNYHIIIDEKDLKRGIVELRYIDPKKIKKVRQISKPDNQNRNNSAIATVVEFYEYNESGIDNKQVGHDQGIKISKDSIAHANSGLTDPKNKVIISYLHKAMANANKLRTLENSMVIYRLVRAPERRLIYVDTGNLPRARAEQYMQSVMQKYKTKVTYDTISGKVKDDRNIMALTEDYFIPRQNGSKSTEFSTLQGTNGSQGAVDEIEYLKKELLRALNVPFSRLDSNSVFSTGRGGEISREEARFTKFIQRLRVKFNDLFDTLLGKELVITKVMSIEEWEYIRKDIHYDYIKDNYFTELQDADSLATRLGVLAQIEPYIGRFYSDEYVKKNVLKQTDEDIKLIAKQIEQERAKDMDAHTTSDVANQVDLQSKLATIEVDKHASTTAIEAGYNDDTNKPNPFKK